MVLLFFGPPGSGKGTQSKRITEWLSIPAISTGELFRAEMQQKTRLGLAAQKVIARGELVGDEIVNAMVERRVSQPDVAGGFLLDGYPRTVRQAAFFEKLLEGRGMPPPTILHLDVPRRVLLERLSGRRYCPGCERIYNVYSQPPRVAGVCDFDGVTLQIREDDREEIVLARQEAYDRQTGPVIDHYLRADYHRLDGNRPAGEVSAAIERILESHLVCVRRGARPR